MCLKCTPILGLFLAEACEPSALPSVKCIPGFPWNIFRNTVATTSESEFLRDSLLHIAGSEREAQAGTHMFVLEPILASIIKGIGQR